MDAKLMHVFKADWRVENIDDRGNHLYFILTSE